MSNLKPMLLTALKSYDKSQFVKDVTAGILLVAIALLATTATGSETCAGAPGPLALTPRCRGSGA